MRHPVYGFDSYENSALLCAGNYDLYSDSVISKFDSGYRKPYKMFSPKDMIDNTRHTHNEIVIERRNIGRYNMYKRMPSYVIFILDDINDKQKFNSDLYKETIQAAVDHNIPILILDRLKYVKSEKKKCEEYYNSFIQTKDYHLLYNFFLTYFNNIIGCISYDDDIKEYNKEFNLSGIMVYINKLLSDIEDFSISDKRNTIKCIIDCIELENQKRDEKYRSTEFLYIKLDSLKKYYNEGNKKFIVKDKRILKDIVEYYYSQNDIVQRLIYDDICNGLSRKEIINKINNNVYEGSAIYESREKYR